VLQQSHFLSLNHLFTSHKHAMALRVSQKVRTSLAGYYHLKVHISTPFYWVLSNRSEFWMAQTLKCVIKLNLKVEIFNVYDHVRSGKQIHCVKEKTLMTKQILFHKLPLDSTSALIRTNGLLNNWFRRRRHLWSCVVFVSHCRRQMASNSWFVLTILINNAAVFSTVYLRSSLIRRLKGS
jgi:hypothetical protein